MKTLALTLFGIFLSFLSFSQLSGNLTVGGVSPNYNTVADAVADLNANGMNGDVHFIIRDGIYHDSWGLEEIDGMTAENWIVFSSESSDSSAVVISSSETFSDEFCWELGTANNLRFENLTFRLSFIVDDYNGGLGSENSIGNLELDACHFISDTPEFTWYLELWSCKDLLIQNCRFENTADVLYAASGEYTATIENNTFICHDDAVDLEGFNEIYIRDNLFMDGLVENGGDPFYTGDYCTTVYGNAEKMVVENNHYEGNDLIMLDIYESPLDTLIVRNNTFDVLSGEVYIEYTNYNLFENNTNSGIYELIFEYCSQVNILNSECNYVEVYNCTGGVNISDNLILDGDGAYGELYVQSTSIEPGFEGVISSNEFVAETGNSSIGINLSEIVMNNDENFRIINNSIINTENPFEIEFSDDIEIKFNSVSVINDIDEMIYAYDVGGMEISNNIFYVSDGIEDGNIFQIYLSSEISIHDNVYFWNDSNFQSNFLVLDDAIYFDIADAQGIGYAANAQFEDPEFFDPISDLRFCNENLQGSGLADAGVTEDFFNYIRPNPPSPGFYEFLDLDPSFIYSLNENSVEFTANNLNAAAEVHWDFGDGTSSSDHNPNHTYDELGDYNVTLTVSNPCGEETFSETIAVIAIGVEENKAFVLIIYPNPTDGIFKIENTYPNISRIIITDIQGKSVFEEDILKKQTLDISRLPQGIYLVSGTDKFGKSQTRAAKLILE